MTFATTDICDAHEDKLAAGTLCRIATGFPIIWQASEISGPAVTLKVFEDNALVRSTLETPGNGHVLVIDGGRQFTLRAGRRQSRHAGREERLGRYRGQWLHS